MEGNGQILLIRGVLSCSKVKDIPKVNMTIQCQDNLKVTSGLSEGHIFWVKVNQGRSNLSRYGGHFKSRLRGMSSHVGNQYKFLLRLKCYILIQIPSQSDIYLLCEDMNNSLKFKNNAKHKNLSPH